VVGDHCRFAPIDCFEQVAVGYIGQTLLPWSVTRREMRLDHIFADQIGDLLEQLCSDILRILSRCLLNLLLHMQKITAYNLVDPFIG